MFERHKAVMLLIDPEGGAIIDGNDAAAQFYGCARDRLRALTIQDLNELPPDQVAAEYRKAAAEERNYFMFPHRAAGGETRWVDVYSAPIQVQGKNLLFSVIHDINDRERGKTEREANIELLALLNAETDLPELMKATAALFKAVSGCEAVGIRLQEAEDFPYFETTGFPDEFVEMERSLCARDECGAVLRDSQGYPIHECMCGNIINGRFDPDLPFFTLRGSFWTNCTTDLLASSSEADRQARTRNRCNGEGYESVALLPLRAGGETFGLVQLNDHRPGCFTSHSIRMMENLVSTVASGLAERRSRERAVRQTRLVDGINRIFREALGSATEEILGELCLAEAQELTESKIGFIGEIGSDGLLHDVAMSNPAWVACGMTSPAGHRRLPGDFKLHGLCGRVLLEGRGFFTNDPLSHPDHVGLPEGHPLLTALLGVPLVSDGKTIGMIAVGNREGGYAKEEQDVLESLAPAITEAFARKRAEEGLLRTKAALEEAVVKTSNDLDAARRLLSERTRHLDAFFDHSLTPLVLLDRNFNFIRVNEAYAKACAKPVEDFPGHNHFEFYPSDARPVFEQVLRAREPFQVTARPFEFPDHPEWGMTYWDWTLTPLLDEHGEVEALVFALEDVTSGVKGPKTRRLSPTAWLAGRRLGERKRAALAVPIATAVEVLLFLGISRLGPPSRYLGIPGAAAALIGVVAAVAAGPVAGAIVALAGGVAYLAFLAEFGRAIAWPAIVGSIVLWTLASVVAGIGADWVRRRAADRETLLSQSVKDRDALMESLRENEERYRIVADFTYDWEDWLGLDGRFVYVSPSVERVTGHRREEFIEDPGLFLSLVHREDREAIGRLFELLDATPARLEFRIVRADGEERWIERACQMMHDADGRLLGRRGSNRDVTERKRAETERERLLTQEQELVEELSAANEQLRMQTEELAVRDEELQSQNEELVLIQEVLTESGRLGQALNHVNESLNSILEFSEVLRQVVREGAVALGAERAVLELREEDGWLVQELLGLPEHLRGSHLSQEEASVATAMVLQGDVLAIEDARRDPRVNASTLLRYGTTAALVVPVRLRGLILGSLHFIWASGRRKFSIAEMDFAHKLTSSLAFALENARLLEEQTNIAERLQLALLDMPRQAHGVEFSHLYRSATEKASADGDFYDVFPLKDDRIAALIGDVSGHGVDAARIAILVKDIVHAFAHEFRSPSAILRKTNELLIQEGTPGFVTMFFGTLDTQGGLLTYASAGHPNVLRRKGDQAVVLLEAASAPLGVFGDHSWEESEVRLHEEDLLFLYTDGAIEARRNGDFFGQKGLIEALKRWSEPSPELLPQAVLAEVLTFSGGVLTDDVAMVALRLTDGGAHGSPPQG